MTDTEIQHIIHENKKRIDEINTPYDPFKGTPGVIPRTPVICQEMGGEILIPTDMLHDFPQFHPVVKSEDLQYFVTVRFKYDFEYWAAYCARIQIKEGAGIAPFILRRPQRKLLKLMEEQRLAGKPIRIILLKARQWGGSTLVQIYMAWIQLIHRTNWHSVICAQTRETASVIRGMYDTLISNYPSWIMGKIKFRPYQRMQNTVVVTQTGARITVGSAEAPDTVRGQNFYMAHMSEVAMYPTTTKNNPALLFRATTSSILPLPYTIVVLESTANGTGNWFHEEWLKAKNGNSDKTPLFVAWYEIEIYSMPLDIPYEKFIASMTEYEWMLWNMGATLEAINWYRYKAKECHSDDEMKSEFPSDDIEAFVHSGEIIFSQYHCNLLRKSCRQPETVGDICSKTGKSTGAESIKDIDMVPFANGRLQIWAFPDKSMNVSRRYIVSVDVGGRSAKADFSVITVIDRYWIIEGGVPEVVAQWRGHIDHDLLTWKAVQIAIYYNNALLVIESNTLETKDNPAAYTDDFILDQIADVYPNLYARHDPQRIRDGLPPRWGFHTNRATKNTIVDYMIAVVREAAYIERDHLAVNEMETYERKPNGAYGAIDGCHDDIIMTRMIALYVSSDIEPPAIIETNTHPSRHVIASEATF